MGGLLEELGIALSGGVAAAGKTASETILEQAKQEALSVREENMARITNLYAKEGRAETQKFQTGERKATETFHTGERKATEAFHTGQADIKFGREVAGYVDGRPVTQDELKTLPEEAKARIQNPEAYKIDLLVKKEREVKGDEYVGIAPDGTAWKASDITEYRKTNEGKNPPGFKVFKQIEIETSQKREETAAKREESYGKQMDALIRYYDRKGDAPGEKPLTADQKMDAEFKTFQVLAKAEKEAKDAGADRVPDSVLSGINSVRLKLGLPELVAKQVETTPVKKGFFSDTPAVTVWRYVPYAGGSASPAKPVGSDLKELVATFTAQKAGMKAAVPAPLIPAVSQMGGEGLIGTQMQATPQKTISDIVQESSKANEGRLAALAQRNAQKMADYDRKYAELQRQGKPETQIFSLIGRRPAQ